MNMKYIHKYVCLCINQSLQNTGAGFKELFFIKVNITHIDMYVAIEKYIENILILLY